MTSDQEGDISSAAWISMHLFWISFPSENKRYDSLVIQNHLKKKKKKIHFVGVPTERQIKKMNWNVWHLTNISHVKNDRLNCLPKKAYTLDACLWMSVITLTTIGKKGSKEFENLYLGSFVTCSHINFRFVTQPHFKDLLMQSLFKFNTNKLLSGENDIWYNNL